MSTGKTPDYVRIKKEEVLKFCEACMQTVGTEEDQSRQLSNVLVEADYRGHFSHGLNRLPFYVRDIREGITEKQGTPVILKQSGATAWVDGRNMLGPMVGNFCMDLAIKKAKDAGIGWVVAKGSSHYGIAGWYSMRALEQGMIGISMTNSTPIVTPTRAKGRILGTSPICVAAPAKDGDSFVLDMATSSVASGKIEMLKWQKERIPNGWCLDSDGKPTDDPSEVVDRDGSMQPLGGSEITGGYKGYGLSTLVDVLCGILGGAAYGPNVRLWTRSNEKPNLGQMFAAIDPARFCDDFEGRLSDFMGILRGLEPADPDKPVLVAGDPERQHMAKVDSEGGIPYHRNLVDSMNKLATELGVTPMKQE